MIRFKKVVPIITLSILLGVGMDSSYARNRIENVTRPLDYLFKNGFNYRMDWVGSSANSLGASFAPVTESFKLSIEAIQASSASIGKSSASLGSSDTLNTSNPIGGGSKMEKAVQKAQETMSANVSTAEEYSENRANRMNEIRDRFKNTKRSRTFVSPMTK